MTIGPPLVTFVVLGILGRSVTRSSVAEEVYHFMAARGYAHPPVPHHLRFRLLRQRRLLRHLSTSVRLWGLWSGP